MKKVLRKFSSPRKYDKKDRDRCSIDISLVRIPPALNFTAKTCHGTHTHCSKPP